MTGRYVLKVMHDPMSHWNEPERTHFMASAWPDPPLPDSPWVYHPPEPELGLPGEVVRLKYVAFSVKARTEDLKKDPAGVMRAKRRELLMQAKEQACKYGYEFVDETAVQA